MMDKIGIFLERNSGRTIFVAVAITVLLIIPLLTMESEEQASSDPAGEVFYLRDAINESFPPTIHYSAYIVESRNGDVLTQAVLWELYQNEKHLRDEDQRGGLTPENLSSQTYLYEAYDVDVNRSFLGAYSLADAVADVLISDPWIGTTLENATDDQVKQVLYQLFSDPETSGLKGFLSTKAENQKRIVGDNEIDYWISPAMLLNVLADNEKLGGGTLEIGVGGDEVVRDKEEFNRNVQKFLRGDEQTFRLWGVAIDVNLEAADEGQTAGYFIMFTVIAVVLVAGFSLRSYWAVVLTGVGLGSLMIWLKGISNLVGLKGGLVVDMIVPIAMISLGIDFALHSLRRYREEKGRGCTPGMALRAGFVGVLGALMLAMASDSIAFLANTSSGIEAVIQFGIAAGIAVVSSFIILGVVLPLAMMQVDKIRGPTTIIPTKKARFMTLINSVGVAALLGTGVIFLVAVSKPLGIFILFAVAVAFLAVPMMIMRRRKSRHEQIITSAQSEKSKKIRAIRDSRFVTLIGGLARYRFLVLPIIIGVTIVAIIFATKLEATFDVKDFFDSKSDFVVSLDMLDEHFAETGGEPGIIYVEGELTDPKALTAIDQFILKVDDNPSIAKWADSDTAVFSPNIISLVKGMMSNDLTISRVETLTGVKVIDADDDGLPDSKEHVEAIYTYMLTEGVPLDENTLIYNANQIREILFYNPNGNQDAVTTLTVAIPGTREQQNVIAARDSLSDDLKVLRENYAFTFVGLTGSPFTRLAQLDATTKTLQSTLPIAAGATLLLLLIVMRSLRYAIVTIIPIGLVVAWLYGFMFLTGFALNYVTATIGAVSIGVGIDYSIHMTERFREEIHKASNKMQALCQAINGTGIALLASAASSIIGFSIMGFAPMPMFSAYGILTAVMIFLALLASLVVLPS
ncbi:MAG: MMPL family transporter, partial [Dehalococcoidia bacterium]